MAEAFFRSMDRRSFIQTGLAAFGTLVTLNSGCGTGLIKADEQQVNLALLADTHIPEDVENNYRGFYPYQNLQKVVPEIISASPDGVFIAGDLARLTGESGDYANLKKLLSPVAEKTPVFMGLGNHDDRQNFLKVFNETPGEKPAVKGKHITIIEKAPVRLIMLDSLLYTNKVPGLLGKAQRQWLENYLKECDEMPTILCFHHTLSDGDGDLLDVPRLYSMIAPIRKVKAIVYGHSHEYGFSEFEGIHLINLPATGYNFSDSDAVGWVQARLTNRGGDFVLHAVAGNKEHDGSVTKLAWRRG
jgi:Icc protein